MAELTRLDIELNFTAKDLVKNVNATKGSLSDLQDVLEKTLDATAVGRGKKYNEQQKEVRSTIQGLIKDLKILQKEGSKNLNIDVAPKKRAQIMGGVEYAASKISASGPTAIAIAQKKQLLEAERELAKAERERSKALAALDQEMRRATKNEELWNRQLGKAVFGSEERAKSAITMRYALYDVSSAAQSVGQSFTTMTKAVVGAAMAQETSFTQVEKTLAGLSNGDVQKLKQDLIDLSTTIPISFDEIARISMLGSQMGVSEQGLASFTETVAQFTAVTGVSADAAAENFGKVATLLGLMTDAGKVDGEAMKYLGSAIMAVGFESAATEEQILSTTKQIGAIGTQAGLSAGQVIGLASSFASMGIAPEESRGVIVQLFNEMSKASNSYSEILKNGNDRLRTFSEVAQAGLRSMSDETKTATITQKQFADAWSNKSSNVIDWTNGVNNAAEAFQVFAAGLNEYDVANTLGKIGLDGVRTSKGLTTLSAGFQTLSAQMELAVLAGEQGGALNDAYGKKADDLASKLQELGNSFEALMASMADAGALNVFGLIVDGLKFLVNGIRNFMKIPFAGAITAIFVAAGALIGTIGLLVGVVTRGYASFLAFKTSLLTASQSGISLDSTMGRMMMTMARMDAVAKENAITTAAQATAWAKYNQQLQAGAIAEAEAAAGANALAVGQEAVAVGTTAASRAMKALKWAMVSTGILGVVVLIGSLISAFGEASDAGSDAEKAGLSDFQNGIKSTTEQTSKAIDEIKALFDAISALQGKYRSLASSEYQTGRAAKQLNGDFHTQRQALRDYEDQVVSMVTVATAAYGDNEQKLGEWLTQFRAFLVKNGYDTISTLRTIDQQIKSISVETGGKFAPMASLYGEFTNIGPAFAEGFNSMSNSADNASGSVETLLEKIQKALDLLNKKSAMRGAMRDLGASLQEVGKSFDTMTSAGSQNLDNLNSTIESIVDAAGGNAQKTANSLGALRKAMWQSGVTSKTAYGAIDKAIATTGKKSKVVSTDVKDYFTLISTGMKSAVDKNVRSIRDWANDVSGVVKDAFDIRFEKMQAFDELTGMWYNLSDGVDSANKSIKDLQATLDDLKSNRSVLEYQLMIAEKYGDSMRAASIRSKLAKNNTDIADTQGKVNDEIDKSNKTLVGNSAAAIKNRADILNIVKAYQGYLVTVAATTTSQEDLAAAANGMQSDFVGQAKALGFSEEELKTYANTISTDFLTATKNIPKDITLELTNTDPVVAAIATFVSKANTELDKIKVVDLSGNVITVDSNAGVTTITAKSGEAPKTNATSTSTSTNNGNSTTSSNQTGSSTATGPQNGSGKNTSGMTYAPSNGGIVGTPIAGQFAPNSSGGITNIKGPSKADPNSIFNGMITFTKTFPASKAVSNAYDPRRDPKTGEYSVFNNSTNGFISHMTREQILATRKGKPAPTIVEVTKQRAAYKKYMAELVAFSKLSSWDQTFGPKPKMSDIVSEFGMDQFIKKYGAGYATGGLVTGPGSGTSDSIPARLSNNEFVIQANAVRHYGADFMSALNNLQVPVTGGANGGGSGVVYLSPEDRALLRAAIDRPITLYTENARIAQSANAGNVELARRGNR